MQFTADIKQKEIKYLIDLLNKDYVQIRTFKEQLQGLNFPEVLAEDMKYLTEKCQRAMDENETLCHKFDDELTDLGRGRKLNG